MPADNCQRFLQSGTIILDVPGWNKLHFASAKTFVYTKMFAVHDRAHKNRVIMLSEQKYQQERPFVRLNTKYRQEPTLNVLC